MHARAIPERSVRTGARRSFWRHFAEMVVAMFVSMAVFGAAVSGVFALLGHGDVLDLPALRGFLMTGYMILGMALWMRYRGHPWAPVAEMSVAMAIPYAVLLGPFAAGLVDEAVFLGAMHVLMLPLMYATMIHRRAEYETHHSGATGRSRSSTGASRTR